jgi:AraC-like DNA-binding protein
MELSSEQQAGFSNAALVSLIAKTLRDISPSLVPPDFKAPDAYAAGSYPADQKRKLLEYALDVGGIFPILSVGLNIGLLQNFPVGQALVKNFNSDVLAQKWMRFEKYNHTNHRLDINIEQEHRWSCSRYWVNDCPAAPVENILICGLLCGLLSFIGKQSLVCNFAGTQINWPVIPRIGGGVEGDTTKWNIQWSGQSVGQKADGVDTLHLEEGNTFQIRRLLAEDVARNWTVAEISSSLGKSVRSLQRGISLEGHTFSSIVRQIRIEEASRYLLKTDHSLAEIGYCCGYSDQAHFQRDFKRATNMTPSQFKTHH